MEAVDVHRIFKSELRAIRHELRDDIKKEFCSRADIMKMMDVKNKWLVEHMKKKECLIMPVNIFGKYDLKSVIAEIERLKH